MIRALFICLALALLAAAPAAGQTVNATPAELAVLRDSLAARARAVQRIRGNRAVDNRLRDSTVAALRRDSARVAAILARPPIQPPPPAPLDSTVVHCAISPRSGPSVLVGDTLRFGAVCADSAGVARRVTVAWSSADQGVATISATGLARGVSAAFVWIRAAAQSARDSVRLEVRTPTAPPPDPTEPGVCTLTLQNQTIQGNFTAPAGARVCFGPGVQVQGNVIVKDWTLQMRAGGSLRFLGADPARYVGGGLTYSAAVDSDVGLWVTGSGQLDISCTPKRAWSRTSTDPTWLPGDEYWIAPTAAGDFQPRRWTPGQPVPVTDGLAAEILNVTRDCAIFGPGHIHVNSSKPQRVEYVRLEGLGIFGVLGRYALHLHYSGDGTRGTTIRGVAAVNSAGTCFVPHASHGTTWIDNAAVNCGENGMWWDQADATDDLLIDHMAIIGVREDAFLLGAGTNTEVRNSAAAGANGNDRSVGFEWPEPTPIFDPVLDRLVWRFDVGNVAHNNVGSGLRFWNNSDAKHVVRDYSAYRNRGGCIENGAYVNLNVYDGVRCFEDGYEEWVAGIIHPAAIWNNNSGDPGDGSGRTSVVQNARLASLQGPALVIGHRQVPAGSCARFGPGLELLPAPGQPKVFIQSAIPETSPARLCFQAPLRPEDIVFESYAGTNEGSEILIDGTLGRWTVRVQNGLKVVTPR